MDKNIYIKSHNHLEVIVLGLLQEKIKKHISHYTILTYFSDQHAWFDLIDQLKFGEN